MKRVLLSLVLVLVPFTTQAGTVGMYAGWQEGIDGSLLYITEDNAILCLISQKKHELTATAQTNDMNGKILAIGQAFQLRNGTYQYWTGNFKAVRSHCDNKWPTALYINGEP